MAESVFEIGFALQYAAAAEMDPDGSNATDNRLSAVYTYTNDQNKYLQALEYGNGAMVQYTYDDQGRLLTQT